MGLLKNEHGVYIARKRVPSHLREAVAVVLSEATPTRAAKSAQTFLQRSLRTKDLHEAKVQAKPVLIEFDRILARAAALVSDTPVRSSLSPAEIERMADYLYASMLVSDDAFRQQAPDIEREQRRYAGEEGDTDWPEPIPEFGMTGGQMADANETMAELVPQAEQALARGDISYVAHRIADVLALYRIRLDRKSEAYRQLGLALLRAYVRAFRAIAQRVAGEPIVTPKVVAPEAPSSGETLRAAFQGWQKATSPAAGTLAEYTRAIGLFVQLHGDLPVVQIKKPHARAFREALQDVPHTKVRAGALRHAPLPELAAWGREHPEASKITNGTINKLLGGVQAVCAWAFDNGLIPDEVAWSDPFHRMRLDEEVSERAPFDARELRALFGSPVFTAHERPQGGKGEAAYWLPLLALYTGARQSELASLTVADAQRDEATGTPVLVFSKQKARGKTLKTQSSARTMPVHPQLLRFGWEAFVEHVRARHGKDAWLFPLISPQQGSGSVRAWSKWINRHMDECGVDDPNKVFHSFRHGFADALRAAQVPEDLSKALAGHVDGSVHARYGAKSMAQRYGMPALVRAVCSVDYPGLDLSSVKPWKKPRAE